MSAPSDDFVHMHLHTHASNFDGLGTEAEFVERAVEIGQRAICVTDHGTLRGVHRAHEAAKKHGIQFVPGIEAYLADDAEQKGLTDDDKAAIKLKLKHATADEVRAELKRLEKERSDRDHVTIWATSEEGLRNLFRLSSWAWTRGFYRKPRVDVKRLCEYSTGLAISTGCPSGVIAKPLAKRAYAEAIGRIESLLPAFEGRFLVEIMPHCPPGHEHVGPMLLRLAERYSLPVVATQDAHYPRQSDAAAQEALLCIQTKGTMSDPDRFCFDSQEYWMSTRAELHSALLRHGYADPIVRKALDETCLFAERSVVPYPEPKPGAYLVAPKLPTGTASYDEWLKELVFDGFADRLACTLPSEYVARVRHELATIRDAGFAPYFVAVWDMRRWARENGIPSGPGRGSAAGSLVCYLLRITDVDPILHDLSFSRFMAPGRKELPDIDVDYASSDKDRVFDYLRETYGENQVAQISTHNVLRGKQTLRDLARIYAIPQAEILPVTSLVVEAIEETERAEGTLRQVLESTAPGRSFAERYPDIAKIAIRLEGNMRGVGCHAAGVVVTPGPTCEYAPVESRARTGGDRVPVIAFDMKGVEAMGMVKFDVLALRDLSVIADAAKAAGVDIESIPIDDEATLQAFTDRKFSGVFQFDSVMARRLCKGFTFARFDDIAVMTALDRPGPAMAGLPALYIERANDPSAIPEMPEVVWRCLGDTYGVLVYQEQVVKLAEAFGYSAVEADKVRKKVAKKIGLEDEEPKFVAGAITAGLTEEQANRLFTDLAGFGSYAFNKSHSYSYALIAYQCQYLKVRHPAEFFTSVLAYEQDRNVQVRFAAEARNSGIRVSPPDVCNPLDRFALVTGFDGKPEIVGAVTDVKGVGEASARTIAANAPYVSLLDFYEKTRASKDGRITVAHFKPLAQAGAFRRLFKPHKLLVENAERVWALLQSGHDVRAVDPVPTEYTEDEAAIVASNVYPLYSTASGQTATSAIEDAIGSRTSRQVYSPGDTELDGKPFALVLGRLGAVKRFAGRDGERSGRIALYSSHGDELIVRLDQDVVERSSDALGTIGAHLLVSVDASREGRVSGDAVWVHDSDDPFLSAILKPVRTIPRDPFLAMKNRPQGEVTTLSGSLLRVRKHVDKSGSRMLTLRLLGERSAVRLLVFASVYRDDPAFKQLVVGQDVKFRVESLGDGVAACRAVVR